MTRVPFLFETQCIFIKIESIARGISRGRFFVGLILICNCYQCHAGLWQPLELVTKMSVIIYFPDTI